MKTKYYIVSRSVAVIATITAILYGSYVGLFKAEQINSCPRWYLPFVERDRAIIQRNVMKIVDTIRVDSIFKHRYWNYEYKGGMKDTMSNFWIEKIVYSTDCTKSMSFVIFQLPHAARMPTYDCRVVFGTRESIGSKWAYYGWDWVASHGYLDPDQAFQHVWEYYVGEYMKNVDGAPIYRMDGTYGFERFRYNLRDTEYWDSCIIWRKSPRGAGIYLFQTWTTRLDSEQVLPAVNVVLSSVEENSFKAELATFKNTMGKMQ